MHLTVPCPYCQSSTTYLSIVSSISRTDLYQCEACGKISERPKGALVAPVPLTTRNTSVLKPAQLLH